MTATLKFDSSDLSSRTLARGVRERVEHLLRQGECVELDLSEVCSISDSYADELFAILANDFGVDVFSSKVRIRSSNDRIFRRIAKNIHTRLSTQNGIAA